MLLAPPQERIWTPPVKALKKDILMDMARRAQPVIYEVEARKQWSTQNASSSAQGGGLLTMPSGRGLLQRGVIGGRDAPDNLLGTLVGGQKRDRLPEGAGSVEGAPLNSNNSKKGGLGIGGHQDLQAGLLSKEGGTVQKSLLCGYVGKVKSLQTIGGDQAGEGSQGHR